VIDEGDPAGEWFIFTGGDLERRHGIAKRLKSDRENLE
jgi:hypothetical protein